MEKELLNRIIDNSPVAVFLYQDREFIYLNNKFVEIWQYNRQEINEINLFTHIHPDIRDQVKEIFRTVENSDKKESRKIVFRARRKDGRSVWLRFWAQKIQYNEEPALLGNLLDITDRIEWDLQSQKRFDASSEGGSKDNQLLSSKIEELEKVKNQLKETEKLAELGKLSGNISHEIKTPLAVIDGSLRYLQRNLEDPSDAINSHLERIRRNVQKTNHIIRSLKNIKNMDKTNYEKLELTSLLKKLISQISFPYSIEVRTVIDEENIYIKGNYILLEVAFKNIILNAIEAMEDGGVFKVKLDKNKNKDLFIHFEDTGPGMSKSQLENIFKPLFTTKEEGSGFGLHLVKKIIEAHDGSIDVNSALDEGSEFIIRLPYFYHVQNVNDDNSQ
ncbi:MAG: PAS domain-containing sensor histidine kinase [Candidatus Marinimicrobia bacterium]|nr:PAS domain-containing sensor histidine kinase [Candidatus Neomarinimicrobiota bacterium]